MSRHPSSSSSKEAIVCIERSYDEADGYISLKTFDMIRATRNRASALDTLVDSPGSVGWNPRSVTFSSSTSEGYSVWMSSSFRIVGIPRDAAEKLEARKLCEIKHFRTLTYQGYITSKRPSSLFHGSARQERNAFDFGEVQDGKQA